MFDEPRQLVEFLWVLAAPMLGQQADIVLVDLGVGFALLLVATLAAALISVAVRRPVLAQDTSGARQRIGRRARSRPLGVRHPSSNARPRAPGAALV